MKTIKFIFILIIKIFLIPFNFIDFVFFTFPEEYKAKKWRKNIKVGDCCYFKNILGGRSSRIVKKIYPDKKGVWIEGSNSSGYYEIKELYPYEN